MHDIERLGAFYLGSTWDPGTKAPDGGLLLYDARDLTTHAVCLGMTGSGKTGLCVTLLEEAAIDGVPAIAIDPKGDLGNLLLTFPDLAPGDFRPWVDAAEAERLGVSVDQHAANVATAWRQGLAASGQDPSRIARLRSTVDLALYTPGAAAGRPLSVLRSFAPPPAGAAADPDALRDRVLSTVSGLLSLLGIEADPVRSREHVLLATLIDLAWRDGKDVALADLIRAVLTPPFGSIGALDLESFFPARERARLAEAINGVLAAPGFAAWMQGEPLDVQRLLWTAEGKPRLSILSIAHLGDAERMFFVTALLGEVVAWMRSQPGTPSLRAILYMDEIFGFFPPVANPPSKAPMLTLLKQARAFGLGVVVATQNPVDLDYKGLANAGTWFVGRLQTERDRSRVLDALLGAQGGGGLDRAALESTLAGLEKRVFYLHNVHEDRPALFQSRWALSYLRGPLTRAQTTSLAAPARRAEAPPSTAGAARPVLPPEAGESFAAGGATLYRPALLGQVRLHFVSAQAGVDVWEDLTLLAPLDPGTPADPWDRASIVTSGPPPRQPEPVAGAGFGPLPGAALRAASYAAWTKRLQEAAYRTRTLRLWRHAALRLTSVPGESEGDFRTRVAQRAREKRDAAVDALKKRFAARLATLDDRIRRAAGRLGEQEAQYDQQKTQTLVSVGATILGAVLGRKSIGTGSLGRATTAARGVGRSMKERGDVDGARAELEALRRQHAELDAAFRQEAASLEATVDPTALPLDAQDVRARKGDISVQAVSLIWIP